MKCNTYKNNKIDSKKIYEIEFVNYFGIFLFFGLRNHL